MYVYVFVLILATCCRAATQDGMTALMEAASGGHVDCARLLLDSGADTRPVTLAVRCVLRLNDSFAVYSYLQDRQERRGISYCLILIPLCLPIDLMRRTE